MELFRIITEILKGIFGRVNEKQQDYEAAKSFYGDTSEKFDKEDEDYLYNRKSDYDSRYKNDQFLKVSDKKRGLPWKDSDFTDGFDEDYYDEDLGDNN